MHPHSLSQALMLSIGSAVEKNNTILTTSLNTRVCCKALNVFYSGKQSHSNILSIWQWISFCKHTGLSWLSGAIYLSYMLHAGQRWKGACFVLLTPGWNLRRAEMCCCSSHRLVSWVLTSLRHINRNSRSAPGWEPKLQLILYFFFHS